MDADCHWAPASTQEGHESPVLRDRDEQCAYPAQEG